MGLSASIVSRRRVLAGAGAAVTCLSLPRGAEALGAEALGADAVRAEALRAQEAGNLTADGFQVLHARAGSMRATDGAHDAASERQIWGFEGAASGPLLRVKRGDELRVRLVNALPDAATIDCAIHWHGVRAANLMDGAPGLTQSAVAVGARFD